MDNKFPKLHNMNKKYCENLDNLINEHKRLVNVLKHPKKNKIKKEINIQNKELKEYKKHNAS